MSDNAIRNKRAKLHKEIKRLVGVGVEVYFEADVNTNLDYPCVIYKRVRFTNEWAGNSKYLDNSEYDITYVSMNPDDEAVKSLLTLPMSSYDRRYVAQSLYHDVIQVFI